jgi:uncharacterized protein (TIGR00369 family)
VSTAHVLPDRSETWHRELHPDCFVCSMDNPCGLGLEFAPERGGGVAASFRCRRSFSGYRDRLHGGVVASLLDGAMTYCAFTHGIVAVTADLQVRYRRPVGLAGLVRVRAWLVDIRGPVIRLRGQVDQDEEVCATAMAKFMAPNEPLLPADQPAGPVRVVPLRDRESPGSGAAR